MNMLCSTPGVTHQDVLHQCAKPVWFEHNINKKRLIMDLVIGILQFHKHPTFDVARFSPVRPYS